jgi:hypothetical protein
MSRGWKNTPTSHRYLRNLTEPASVCATEASNARSNLTHIQRRDVLADWAALGCDVVHTSFGGVDNAALYGYHKIVPNRGRELGRLWHADRRPWEMTTAVPGILWFEDWFNSRSYGCSYGKSTRLCGRT